MWAERRAKMLSDEEIRKAKQEREMREVKFRAWSKDFGRGGLQRQEMP